jgi:para-aminobenzoate synthetase
MSALYALYLVYLLPLMGYFSPTVAWFPHSIKAFPYNYKSHNHHQQQQQPRCFELHTSIPSSFGTSGEHTQTITGSANKKMISDFSSWQEGLDDYDSYQRQKLDLQLLIVDNYDSYTYNLYSYLSTICKHPPIVVPNDAYTSWEHLKQDIGKNIDGIVISPGPGRPERKEDMGICLEAIRDNPMLPILGVCLGHQALGYYYNATVELAPNGPVHGLLSPVRYMPIYNNNDNAKNATQTLETCDLFQGIPQDFNVVRYHSLVVEFPCEKGESNLMIEPIAWCKSNTEAECAMGHNGSQEDHDGIEICMALRHKIYPHYGVQFHPESVGTGKDGYQLLKNFCNFCLQYRNTISSQDRTLNRCGSRSKLEDHELIRQESIQTAAKYKVFVHKVSNHGTSQPCPELVFEKLFATLEDAFWLDSSTGRKDADIVENDIDCPIISNSRFSIMGGNLGPLCKKIEYWGKNHKLENQGIFVTDFAHQTIHEIGKGKDIISFLRDEIVKSGFSEKVVGITFDNTDKDDFEEIVMQVPFHFHGGYVGYLGYEVWHDTLSSSGVNKNKEIKKSSSDPYVPTAAFLFADRSLVYDHWRDEWYLIGVTETSDASPRSKENLVEWMRDTSDKLLSISSYREDDIPKGECTGKGTDPLFFHLKRSKNEYSVDISMCHEKIRQGESYELCLTNQLKTNVSFRSDSRQCLSSSPFGLYKILRENNPAPFSSFMKFNSPTLGNQDDNCLQKSSVSICWSSPERFLAIKREEISAHNNNIKRYREHGWEFRPPFVSKQRRGGVNFIVESKPIKGTKPRFINANKHFNDEMTVTKDRDIANDLQRSTKNRAENLMIVDLLRNDLSRVCEAGSVHVPKLMAIESFATVHQMVSTIRGNVDQACSAIDVIAACFPGGSMTGAPKVRSVDILDELELGQSRGPYSGCLGYISLNGAMDMNIVIRTAVVTPSESVSDSVVSWDVSIGAGGAITALSETNDEFDEMLLKARPVRKSIESWNKNI